MSLLEIPIPPTRKRLKLDMAQDVVADFEKFVEFAVTIQPHADTDNILEFMVTEFFGMGQLSDVKAFRAWCAEQEKKKETTVKATPSSGNAIEPEEMVEVAKKEEGGEKKRVIPSTSTSQSDQTGEMSIPRPSVKREIERRSSAASDGIK